MPRATSRDGRRATGRRAMGDGVMGVVHIDGVSSSVCDAIGRYEFYFVCVCVCVCVCVLGGERERDLLCRDGHGIYLCRLERIQDVDQEMKIHSGAKLHSLCHYRLWNTDILRLSLDILIDSCPIRMYNESIYLLLYEMRAMDTMILCLEWLMASSSGNYF